MSTIQHRIDELVRRELSLPPDQDATALAYGAIPEWTSASHMNVIIAIEDEFGLEFSPDEIADLTNARKIAAAVEDRTTR